MTDLLTRARLMADPPQPCTYSSYEWRQIVRELISELKSHKCERCGKFVSGEMHPCPFAEEILKDSSTKCNCCDHCENECARDV